MMESILLKCLLRFHHYLVLQFHSSVCRFHVTLRDIKNRGEERMSCISFYNLHRIGLLIIFLLINTFRFFTKVLKMFVDAELMLLY